MNKRDQDNLAKLYVEQYVDYEGESAWIPSGNKSYDDSPLSEEDIEKIYSALENIDTDRFSEILGERTNELYSNIQNAMKIIYPLLNRQPPREEY